MRYKTNQKKHFDLYHTFDVCAENALDVKAAEHPGLEVLVPKSNGFSLKMRGKEQNISPGDAVFYNSAEPHKEIYEEGFGSCDAIVIPDSTLKRYLNEYSIEGRDLIFSRLNPKKDSILEFSFRSLMESRRKISTDKLYSECLLEQMLTHLLESYDHTYSSTLKKKSLTGHYPSKVSKTKSFILDTLKEEKVSLDEISQVVGISKFHLIRIFKKEVGVSPSQFRNILRIEKIKREVLNSGDKKMATIAFSSGFSDLSSFNRLFRKHTGVSPRKFKNTHKEQLLPSFSAH